MIARARPLLAALLLALTAACGDSGSTSGETQTGASTDATATASTSVGTTEGTTDGTGGSASDSSTATTTSTTAATTSTTDATTDATSTTATTDATSTTAATSTTGESTSEGSTSAATTTGGLDMEPACSEDADCTILDSCCECDPHHVDLEVTICDEVCDQSACSAHGLADAKAICKAGRCTFEKVECNPLGILCKSKPPTCDPGYIPGVHDDGNGKCWTGACVPAEACDWAPDCQACAWPGLTCVGHLQKGAYVLCEALPFECGDGPATCACAGAICDESPPWTVCQDGDDGILCECPFC